MRSWLVAMVVLAACGSSPQPGDGGTAGGSGGGGSGGGGSGGGGGGFGGIEGGGNSAWQTVDPLADAGPVVAVATGFQFTEGPVWLSRRGELLFSDIPANEIHVHRPGQNPPTSIFLSPSGNSNGLATAVNGDLIICEHQGRVTRLHLDGGSTVVATHFDGGTLNSPNDAIEAAGGSIFFTDPTYGGTGSVGTRGVYRIAPDGRLSRIYETNDGQPNGVAINYENQLLYVSDSQRGEVLRFNLIGDVPSAGTRFLQTSSGGNGGSGGDGIALDVAGNLYVTTSVGVKVYRPDAGYWGTIAVPQEPSNCAFGGTDGKTLFITARTGVYMTRVNLQGVGF